MVIDTDRHWQRFIEGAGRLEWRSDSRLANHASPTQHAADIVKRVAEVPAGRTTEAWEKALAAADIPHARKHPLTSLLDDPHLDEVGFFSRSHHPAEGAVRTMRVAARWSASQTVADAACTGARGTEPRGSEGLAAA